MFSYSNLIWPLVFRGSLAIVMVFGFIGFAVGIGLIVSSAKTFRFLHAMNRWVSIRPALKSAEIPRDSDRYAHKYRYWIGIPLVVGGLFSTFGLVARINALAVGATFAKGTMAQLLAILAEALRWFLIIGSVSGVVIGIMLCFSLDVLAGFEKYANRWISPRRLVRGGDEMHPALDNLVEAYPRHSGWIFTCTGLGAVAYAAFLLFTRH